MSQEVYSVQVWFHHWFMAPDRNIWELQEDCEASRSWKRNVFWSWDFLWGSTVCWRGVIDEHWAGPTGWWGRERPGGWWKKARNHLHLMAATTDTLHCLSMPPLSVRLYHEANVNMCVMTLLGPLHHATFIYLCLLESALRIPLNLL